MKRTIFCILLALSLPALADEAAVGYVKTLSGEATVTTQSNTVPAQLGTPLFRGSRIKTAHKSSLGVIFKDDTVMSFGADTELTVDDYLYVPSQGKLKLSGSLIQGTLNYVSGVIAKLRPDAVSIKTPTGTIGVRGTQFVALVEEPAP